MSAVDQIARDEAGDAMSRITTHEAVCAERYAGIQKSFQSGSEKMKELGDDIKGVKGDIKAAVVKLIVALFGAVGAMGGVMFAMLRATS